MAAATSQVTADIVHGQGLTEIRLRRRGRLLSAFKLVAFLAVWLLAGGFAGILLAATSDQPFILIAWLAIWGIAGLVFLSALIWGAFGTETLVARSDSLTLLRRLLIFGKPTVIPAHELTGLRWIADDPMRTVKVNGRRIAQTSLEIAGTGTTLRCARGIGEREAGLAISAARDRLAVALRRRT